MKTSLKRIHTKDGIELVGLLYEPDDNRGDQILVHVHGMGGNFYENPFLDAMARTLTSNGFSFFAFNNRGCESFKDLSRVDPVGGKRTQVRIGNAYELFEDSLLDIGAAMGAVTERGFSKIHLAGHSLGCSKVAYHVVSTQDPRIASVLFLSPSDMLGLVRDKPECFKEDNEEAVAMAAAGKGHELMSRQVWDEYPISAASYLSIFGDDSKAAIFNFYDPADHLEALGRIKQPIFAVMGRKDNALVIAIEDTFSRLAAAAKNSAHVETKILGDADHGYEGDEQRLADEILMWLKNIPNLN